MEASLFEQAVNILANYGAMGVMLGWFMFKSSKDNEKNTQAVLDANERTQEALNELRFVIAKIGGVSDEQ
ncbi:hypothetical protein MWG61_13300 [Bacillus safensis]|uniref:hypothetical protein n=1 Tax=Bacillus TaxID=1386 RepID=UPI0007EED713|nr:MULTISPECIES: hypothetical protein [Bacillus]MCY7525116.1 hypothetical protein [Bacillus safensis]OBS85767.1 hypothetical protein BAY68_19300 [Bacillus pumilus]